MSGSPSNGVSANPLQQRLGQELYAKRLKRQTDKFTKLIHQGEGVFRVERVLPFDAVVSGFFRLFGLRKAMRKRFLDVQVVRQEWFFSTLPAAFEGFRLLQLTDLHCDLDPALMPVVIDLVRGTAHDAAVITGDFRNAMEGDHTASLRDMQSLNAVLSQQRWGVLGNHDSMEMVAELESSGLPILLNEAVEIVRGQDSLGLAGIDDPHYYKTHDLAAARKCIPAGTFAILLSHSPETYPEAERLGFDFQLSGHTHGGQICLPGGWPIVVPTHVPKRFVSGRWRHGRLQGYTSRGTGACGVPARWNCPPEITLHVLRRGGRT